MFSVDPVISIVNFVSPVVAGPCVTAPELEKFDPCAEQLKLELFLL